MNRAIGGNQTVQLLREPSTPQTPVRNSALGWLVTGLCVAAFYALLPLCAPLVLAAWAALIAWPLQQRATRILRHRALAAGVLTTLLVFAFLIPIAVSVLSLSSSVLELAHQLSSSKSAEDGLKMLSSSAGGGFDFGHLNWQRAMELARDHGVRALGAGRLFFGAVSKGVLAVVVFLAGFYSLLIGGEQARDWFVDRAPLARGHTQRLCNVFAEVGRGVLIGTGLTAVLQGTLATLGYFVTGVPQALVLGLVTIGAALIPSVGAALVWVPVTIGLFVSHHTGQAVGMLAIGCLVSTADNFARPLLVRYANLRLHALVLFVSMLGGIVVFGAWGLLFGPLLVRLASEGLTMLKEEREANASAALPP